MGCLDQMGIVLLIARIYFHFQTVTSANETLRKRVESVVDMALTTVSSLSELYSGGMSSVANDVVIKPVEKASDINASEVNPTTKEGEDVTDESEEVEA